MIRINWNSIGLNSALMVVIHLLALKEAVYKLLIHMMLVLVTLIM